MENTTSNYVLAWAKAAGIRAIRTAAQTALGLLTIGLAAEEIDWKYVASVAFVAAVYSILTSITGLPEVRDPDDNGWERPEKPQDDFCDFYMENETEFKPFHDDFPEETDAKPSEKSEETESELSKD